MAHSRDELETGLAEAKVRLAMAEQEIGVRGKASRLGANFRTLHAPTRPHTGAEGPAEAEPAGTG